MKNCDYEDYVRVEADVVKAAVDGDDDAYEVIFRRYEGDIVTYLKPIARDLNVPVTFFPSHVKKERLG